MALVPAHVSDGTYKIFSVPFYPNDADLIYPAGATGFIGGHPDNNRSERMVWKVTNVKDDLFTLTNQAIQTYAQINFSNHSLVGNPKTPAVEWAAFQTDVDDEYFVSAFDAALAWTLPNGDHSTPIVLNKIADPKQDNQVWKFVPFERD